MHAYGVGLTTWLVWQALSHRVRSHDRGPLEPTFGMLAVCATAGMGFGALNEVVEFIATLILPSTNVGDHINTGWDLVSNFVGATVAALVIFLVARHRQKHWEATLIDLKKREPQGRDREPQVGPPRT